jgi:hypothetical protein
MTSQQSFNIAEILEPVVGKEQAKFFTGQIEEVVDMKGTKLETKIDELGGRIDKLDGRIDKFFITLVVLILGLYATIIFKP